MREDELDRVSDAEKLFLLLQDKVEQLSVAPHGTLVIGVLALSRLREVVALHCRDFLVCRVAIQLLFAELPVLLGEQAANDAVRLNVVVYPINEDERQALDTVRRKPLAFREMAVDQPVELFSENAFQVGCLLLFDDDGTVLEFAAVRAFAKRLRDAADNVAPIADIAGLVFKIVAHLEERGFA
jgi:hypothetical protein